MLRVQSDSCAALQNVPDFRLESHNTLKLTYTLATQYNPAAQQYTNRHRFARTVVKLTRSDTGAVLISRTYGNNFCPPACPSETAGNGNCCLDIFPRDTVTRKEATFEVYYNVVDNMASATEPCDDDVAALVQAMRDLRYNVNPVRSCSAVWNALRSPSV